MARDVLVVNKLTRNGTLALGTIAAPLGSTVQTQANGQVATPKKAQKLLILYYNSKAGAVQFTIRKGVYPPAEDSGAGDIVVAGIPTLGLQIFGPFDGSRVLQKDGSIQLDADAGASGTIWALEVPA